MSWRHGLSAVAYLTFLMPAAVFGDESDAEALLVEKRCIACHDVARTLLGPSYKAIAARHGAQKDSMIEVLAQKIIVGGAGNWGVVPMVANEHVSLDEARAMSRWILAQE